ncbi:MAG: efflux RND transporter periplasmic adaptor subunit [Myxococcota bacterium]
MTRTPDEAVATSRTPTGEEVRTTLAASRRSRRWRWIATALIVAALGVGAWLLTRRLGEPPPAPSYLTEAVDRGDVVTAVTATGTIEAVRVVEVGAEISGRVVTVEAEVNDEVAEGQVLARLDTEPIEARLEEAEARLDSARASTRQALATLREARLAEKRVKRLDAGGVAAEQQLEEAVAARQRAEASYAAAKAQQRLAEAQLKEVQTDLDKAVIESPVSGIVLTRSVEPGNAVAAQFQTPVLFTIAQDLRDMELRLAVDEADVGRVAGGMPATFTVDAWPDRAFEGEVSLVSFAPTVEQGVVTYETRVSVDNEGRLLRPGMTATATITSSRVEDVLRIPNAALRFAPPRAMRGGPPSPFPMRKQRSEQDEDADRTERRRPSGPVVWVLRGGDLHAVAVTTGVTDGTWTEIRSGDLDAGDRVVVGVERSEP